jgi:hypothetical protein
MLKACHKKIKPGNASQRAGLYIQVSDYFAIKADAPFAPGEACIP